MVVVGVCAMAKKSQSKPMKEILTRLQEFEYIKVTVFPEDVILEVRIVVLHIGPSTDKTTIEIDIPKRIQTISNRILSKLFFKIILITCGPFITFLKLRLI